MEITSGILPFHSIEINKVDMILILQPLFRQCSCAVTPRKFSTSIQLEAIRVSFQTKELSFIPNHHDEYVPFCVMQSRNFSLMHVRMVDAHENLEIRHVDDGPHLWPARYRETNEGRKQGSNNIVIIDTYNRQFVSTK